MNYFFQNEVLVLVKKCKGKLRVENGQMKYFKIKISISRELYHHKTDVTD